MDKLMYVPYHVHSMYSNGTTNIDSVVKAEEYIAEAKKCGMPAFGFSEHGNIFHWVAKKDLIEANGMKFIPAIEAYLTEDEADEETHKHRDNYHIVLIAKDHEGVREINELFTQSYTESHFYYSPRITMEELENTSDHIMITTACLGGVLHKCKDTNFKKRFQSFLIQNKDRVYLEIQHHKSIDQIEYNIELYSFGTEHNIPLIAGTDTHSLTDFDAETRLVYQKSKNVYFDGEDKMDLVWKSPRELLEAYREQGVFADDIIVEAMNNTIKMSERVIPFEMDSSKKYPKLYKDSKKVFVKKILKGMEWRGINQKKNVDEYKKRIRKEFDTYVHNDAIDFMLLEEDYKREMRRRGIRYGFSRGSVSGSLIAYILGITDVDSLKFHLNFERFMNSERVSLADIDTDWYHDDQPVVRKYLWEKEGLYCADIVTFNTVDIKGAIKDIARGMNYSLDLAKEISEVWEKDERRARQLWPQLFKYVDRVRGCIVSVGNHPSAFLVSPAPIDREIGLFRSKKDQYPITCINMKEVDRLNYVKLDILGLDTVGLIYKTCDSAGIDFLTPDNIDPNDENVWKSIRDDTTCIFQWESDMATSYIKNLFSDQTIERIKKVNPNFNYMDLFSIGNAALRPAGASYRDDLAQGKFEDLGHPKLNEYFSSTLNRMVYQEQLMGFLNVFCGFTMGQADIVRRAFAKKLGTEKYIPTIKKGFIKTMKEQYGVDEKEGEKLVTDFLVIIEDASDYLFSKNHSDPYSYIGYICGYLRYYYPLQFFASALNIYEGKTEKTSAIVQYLKKVNIKLKPITFGVSRGEYIANVEENAIYKGLGSIKYLNSSVAEDLYQLYQNHEELRKSFVDLVMAIRQDRILDSRQIRVLTKLGYFKEYGDENKLLAIIGIVEGLSGSEKILKKDKLKKTGIPLEVVKKHSDNESTTRFTGIHLNSLIKELSDHIVYTSADIGEKAQAQYQFLGYVDLMENEFEKDPSHKKLIVTNTDDRYGTAKIDSYSLYNGQKVSFKVPAKVWKNNKMKEGSVFSRVIHEYRQKKRKEGSKFVVVDGVEELWVTSYNIDRDAPEEKKVEVKKGLYFNERLDYGYQ